MQFAGGRVFLLSQQSFLFSLQARSGKATDSAHGNWCVVYHEGQERQGDGKEKAESSGMYM